MLSKIPVKSPDVSIVCRFSGVTFKDLPETKFYWGLLWNGEGGVIEQLSEILKFYGG